MAAVVMSGVALALSLVLAALRIRDWHRSRVFEARMRSLRSDRIMNRGGVVSHVQSEVA